ncbi:hypothetical protein BD324DRAFT_648991 [Kockovaella imperatae]|uniref:Uncharacterized protein n=1 Tax=Kockovaella imperatae TaxID=4999 RepID=A0A1Y1UN23_9TREE|nr:hypothetical protein BD324DRAFT_648991 [Kockovaella imperatae]ORX38884.1 hypothetical protein BD324DRAFT_648991 [Kockovaella imperatae]
MSEDPIVLSSDPPSQAINAASVAESSQAQAYDQLASSPDRKYNMQDIEPDVDPVTESAVAENNPETTSANSVTLNSDDSFMPLHSSADSFPSVPSITLNALTFVRLLQVACDELRFLDSMQDVERQQAIVLIDLINSMMGDI